MKCFTFLLFLVFSISYVAHGETEATIKFEASLKNYKSDSEALEKKVAQRIEAASKRFIDAVKLYSDKNYSDSKKEVKKSFESAHAALKEKWDGEIKYEEVPNHYIKKILEFGMAHQSFDTMIMSFIIFSKEL